MHELRYKLRNLVSKNSVVNDRQINEKNISKLQF